MTDIDKNRIDEITIEAVKIFRDYPSMTIWEAIEKAKEVMKDDTTLLPSIQKTISK